MLAYVDPPVEEADRIAAAELIRREAQSMTPPAKLGELAAQLADDAQRYQQTWAKMQQVLTARSQKRPRDTAPFDYESAASALVQQELAGLADARADRWGAVAGSFEILQNKLRAERSRLQQAVHIINAQRKADQQSTDSALRQLRAKAETLNTRLEGLQQALRTE